MTRNWTGGGSKAITELGEALALTSAGGDLIRSCVIRGLRGQAYFAQGLLEEAKTDLEQAIPEAVALGAVPYLPLYYCWLAEINGRRGRRDDAVKHAHHAWRLSHRQGQTWTRAPILRALARGLVHTCRPNIAAAERAVRDAIAIHRSMGICIGLANSHVAHAEIRRAAGDAAGSRALLRQARDSRRRMGIKATAIESRETL
jgi:tetratricopeptide (TPR) repeat protein